MALGFYFDMTRCVGCRACQVACKDKNNLKLRGILQWETSEFYLQTTEEERKATQESYPQADFYLT